MRRPLTILFATLLALCIVVALVSFYESFALVRKDQALGASNGVAIWSHSTNSHRPWSLLHERSPAWNQKLPGTGFLGFHYLADSRFRLIGIPLWFPLCVIALALAVSLLASRRHDGKGFDLLGKAAEPFKVIEKH